MENKEFRIQEAKKDGDQPKRTKEQFVTLSLAEVNDIMDQLKFIHNEVEEYFCGEYDVSLPSEVWNACLMISGRLGVEWD